MRDATKKKKESSMHGSKPLSGKSIAIMVASGFNEEHMTDIQKALVAAGAQTTIVSPEVGVANGWHDGGWGHNFFVDEKISDVLPSRFDMLFVPGGSRSTINLTQNAHAIRVLKGMVESGKPVVLTEDAGLVLAAAEVASGRTISAAEEAREKLEAAGASLAEAGFTVDGSLLSLADNEQIGEFIVAIKSALGAEEEAEEAAA
jgi:protease I